jgi:hypothetical protein
MQFQILLRPQTIKADEKVCKEWTPRRLFAYSANDVSLAGFLNILIGATNVDGPGYVTFGAAILVELWRSKQHRDRFFVKVKNFSTIKSIIYF